MLLHTQYTCDSSNMFNMSITAAAMEALYHKGIVHRDLKPQNLLLTSHKSKPDSKDIQIKIGSYNNRVHSVLLRIHSVTHTSL